MWENLGPVLCLVVLLAVVGIAFASQTKAGQRWLKRLK